MKKLSYRRHRFPPLIIRHAIRPYLRFTPGYRDVGEIPVERGVDVSNETIRRRVLKFGRLCAWRLRRRGPKPDDQWHLDEMFVSIRGKRMYPWRAVDSEGEVPDFPVQPKRNKVAAVKLMRIWQRAVAIRSVPDCAAPHAAPLGLTCQSRPRPSRTLGITVVDPRVATVFSAAMEKLAREFPVVGESHPELDDVHTTFRVLRAHQFAAARGDLLERYREQLKPEVVWNIEEGMKLDGGAIIRAEHQRAAIRSRFLAFFNDYDFLVTPSAIMPPYPVEKRYVDECAGHRFDNYLEWMAISYVVTLISCPAISIPAGFTDDGLPVGMQIIAPPRGEARLLSFARRCEAIIDETGRMPV